MPLVATRRSCSKRFEASSANGSSGSGGAYVSGGLTNSFLFPLFKRTDLFNLRFCKLSTLPEPSDLLRFLVVFTMLWRYVAQSANEIHEAVSCLRAAFGTLSSLLGKLSNAASGLARHSAFGTLDSLVGQLSNVASGLARHSAFGHSYI